MLEPGAVDYGVDLTVDYGGQKWLLQGVATEKKLVRLESLKLVVKCYPTWHYEEIDPGMLDGAVLQDMAKEAGIELTDD